MDLQITPKKLSGVVTPPSSKSQAHRLLIAAALSGGISIIPAHMADRHRRVARMSWESARPWMSLIPPLRAAAISNRWA